MRTTILRRDESGKCSVTNKQGVVYVLDVGGKEVPVGEKSLMQMIRWNCSLPDIPDQPQSSHTVTRLRSEGRSDLNGESVGRTSGKSISKSTGMNRQNGGAEGDAK